MRLMTRSCAKEEGGGRRCVARDGRVPIGLVSHIPYIFFRLVIFCLSWRRACSYLPPRIVLSALWLALTHYRVHGQQPRKRLLLEAPSPPPRSCSRTRPCWCVCSQRVSKPRRSDGANEKDCRKRQRGGTRPLGEPRRGGHRRLCARRHRRPKRRGAAPPVVRAGERPSRAVRAPPSLVRAVMPLTRVSRRGEGSFAQPCSQSRTSFSLVAPISEMC